MRAGSTTNGAAAGGPGRRLRRGALGLGAALLLTGSGSALLAVPAQAAGSGVVRWAESAQGAPKWIFPLYPGTDFTVQYQSEFEYLMIPPLYQFGSGTSPAINYRISLAQPPVYQDHDTKVVITLKPYLWSDGTPLTARDVVFWMNLLRAEKRNWAPYVPGSFPDNVVSVRADSSRRLTLTLRRSYSPAYFTANELSQITPIPQHAWDRTSLGGAVGNLDRTPTGAAAVYHFLYNQSKELGTYGSNPLWKVVDGPWRLQSYSVTGRVVFVPNPRYSGPDKPRLAKFIEEPFTSPAAEYDALRAGQLDVGYIPPEDLSTRPALRRAGFTFGQWPVYGFNSLLVNFHNPRVGPLFRQLYLRQALERLINQPEWITKSLGGYGVPTHGPVVNGARSLVGPVERAYPYPYSPTAARALLRAHGWAIHPNRLTTCASPGRGPSQCGAGIRRGEGLALNLVYNTGQVFETIQMETLKSEASRLGVQINLSTNVFAFQLAIPCTAREASCSWQIIDWGGAVYTLPYYPLGGGYFECGALLNYGSYCDRTEVRLDNQGVGGRGGVIPWENYVARQLPMLWIPNGDFELIEARSDLRGVLPANPLLAIFPQDWSYARASG